jgi:hypothetical protein
LPADYEDELFSFHRVRALPAGTSRLKRNHGGFESRRPIKGETLDICLRPSTRETGTIFYTDNTRRGFILMAKEFR